MIHILKNTIDAVQRQRYEGLYLPQIIPVLGALVSIPTGLVSGIRAIAKVSQAIFQRFNEGKPFFKPNDKKMDAVHFPMEDAKDLGLIFANSVINVCTFGILNGFVAQFQQAA